MESAAGDEQTDLNAEPAEPIELPADEPEAEETTEELAAPYMPEEEVQATVFQIAKKTLQNNPLVVAALIVAVLAICCVGGFSRYLKTKKRK